MNRFRNALVLLGRDDSGQDLVEYALVVALIALGSVAAMQSLTGSIATAVGTVGTAITGAFP